MLWDTHVISTHLVSDKRDMIDRDRSRLAHLHICILSDIPLSLSLSLSRSSQTDSTKVIFPHVRLRLLHNRHPYIIL